MTKNILQTLLTFFFFSVLLIVILFNSRYIKRRIGQISIDLGSNKEHTSPAIIFTNYCIEDTIINSSIIEGYVDKSSYTTGDDIRFFIHTISSKFIIKMYLIAKKNILVYTSAWITGMRQNYTACSYKYGCNWKESYLLKIPGEWNSGMYIAEIETNEQNKTYLPIVIRSENSKAKILLLSSDITWQAYNAWGGASFFSYNFKKNPFNYSFANVVSLHRPNNYGKVFEENIADDLASGEMFLIRWLSRNNYNYDVLSESEFHYWKEVPNKYKGGF